MEVKWIIFALFIIFVIMLIVYLIIRNIKDKDEVIKYLNENEIEEKTNLREKE